MDENNNKLPNPTDVLLDKVKQLESKVTEMSRKFTEFEDFNRKLLNTNEVNITNDTEDDSKTILNKIKEVVTR